MVTYEDLEQGVQDINHMVRVGYSPLSADPDIQRRLEDAFRFMKEPSRRKQLSERDRLRLLTLEAEFHQQKGNHLESARILEPEWKRLLPRLEQWKNHKDFRLEPSRNSELLRQKIWLMMHYVFYRYYRVEEAHKPGLTLLRRLEDVTLKELATRTYQPSGTLALLHYFMAMCNRGGRGFVLAEKNMLRAQEETYARLDRELKRPDATAERRAYEVAYKNLICARILFGNSWIALQQGQLVRSEQHVIAGRSLLFGTRQPYLDLLLRVHGLIALRRRTAFGEEELYERVMDRLANAHAEAERLHEAIRRRCAFELVRGRLDIAEFHAEDSERKAHLVEARKWLERVRAPHAKDQRIYLLHSARLFMVGGDLSAAEDMLKRAISLERQKPSGKNLVPRAVLVLQAVVALRRTEYSKAKELLESALAQVTSVMEDPPTPKNPRDPVLEAECYVLLADAHAGGGDYATARRYLEKWQMLSQFVENYYLHHLADHVPAAKAPRVVDYEFPIRRAKGDGIPSIYDRLNDLQQWMLKSVKDRHPEFKDEQLGMALGVSRSQYGKIYPKKKR